ncbi:MAG: hypothetical protein HRT69_18700 [Flavobacteriaceae bacterium]|nr:hypothetical protein [Flavobacteriaceae bacterium]
MLVFVTPDRLRIGNKEFTNYTTREISVDEYKTLKKYLTVASEEGFMYLYYSKEFNEVMEVHLNPDHSILSVELHKGIKDEDEILHVSSNYVLEKKGKFLRQTAADPKGRYFMFWLVENKQVVTSHTL